MPSVEYGSKAAADRAREEHSEHLCSDDDGRYMTVVFSSDTPDAVLDQERAKADESRAEQDTTSVSAELGEGERERISEAGGFDRDHVTHWSWQAAKGVFAREGLLDKWGEQITTLAQYDDPKEGAEEWIARNRASDASKGTVGASGGQRDQGHEDVKQRQRHAEAARGAAGKQCDHAEDHCRHGDPDACEFLQEACGYDEEEVARFLSDTETETEQEELVEVGDGAESMEVPPEVAGALKSSWGGYRSAVNEADEALDTIREQVGHARQAMAAINAIRGRNGQEDLHPDRLHDVLDALAGMPGDMPEVRTLDHFREETEQGGRQIEAPPQEQADEFRRNRQPTIPDEWEGPKDFGEDGIGYQLNRAKMDGGSVAVLATQARNGWRVRVGFLDRLESVDVEEYGTKAEAFRAVKRRVAEYGQDPPTHPDELRESDPVGGDPSKYYVIPDNGPMQDRYGPFPSREKAQAMKDNTLGPDWFIATERYLEGGGEPPQGDGRRFYPPKPEESRRAWRNRPERNRSNRGAFQNQQTRLAGGEMGERGQGELVETVEENPGGLMADQREDVGEEPEREQGGLEAHGVTEGLRDADQNDLGSFDQGGGDSGN